MCAFLCLAVGSWGVRLIPMPKDAIGSGTTPGFFYDDGASSAASSLDVLSRTHRLLMRWSPALDAERGVIVGLDDFQIPADNSR